MVNPPSEHGAHPTVFTFAWCSRMPYRQTRQLGGIRWDLHLVFVTCCSAYRASLRFDKDAWKLICWHSGCCCLPPPFNPQQHFIQVPHTPRDTHLKQAVIVPLHLGVRVHSAVDCATEHGQRVLELASVPQRAQQRVVALDGSRDSKPLHLVVSAAGSTARTKHLVTQEESVCVPTLWAIN